MKNLTTKDIYKKAFGLKFLVTLGEDRAKELVEDFNDKCLGQHVCTFTPQDGEIRCEVAYFRQRLYITDYSCVLVNSYQNPYEMQDLSDDWIAFMSKTDKLSDDEWNNYLDGLNKYADTIAKTAKELAQENLNNYVIPKSKQTDSNTCGY